MLQGEITEEPEVQLIKRLRDHMLVGVITEQVCQSSLDEMVYSIDVQISKGHFWKLSRSSVRQALNTINALPRNHVNDDCKTCPWRTNIQFLDPLCDLR